jgi:hypothetical protein
LQSVINYGLRFGGFVVSIVGQECGPINLKISVWQNISKAGGRDGCYGLNRLIERRGRLRGRLNEITADCAKKRAANINDPCGARCPQLPKVL